MSLETPQKNVLGFNLQPCSMKPLTGFFRDGCCHTGEDDFGQHTVCVQVTKEFLEFSREAGNNLSTPVREANFPGLRPGDRWCLCAARWKEALDAGAAPKILLGSTHEAVLELVDLQVLKGFALDLN